MQKTRSVLQEVGWSWNSYELPRTLHSLPPLFTIIKIKRFIQQNQSWVFCQVLHVSAPPPTEFLLWGQSQSRWDESLICTLNSPLTSVIVGPCVLRGSGGCWGKYCTIFAISVWKVFPCAYSAARAMPFVWERPNRSFNFFKCNKLQQMEKCSRNCSLIL